MFSSRTDWNFLSNDLTKLLEEKRSSGTPIIDLTESNPTRCGFAYRSHILEPLANPESLHYSPDPRGALSARESIAEYYRRKGATVNPREVFLTASTSEAYSYLFTLLCNNGDSVLVPKPSYPLFDYLCRLNDVQATHYRLHYDDEWRVDLGSLEENVDSSTRAMLVVNPNNPTGSYIKRDERTKIIDFVNKHDLALIVDEVFFDFPVADKGRECASFVAELGAPTFVLNGISKLLGLPQMKLAWFTVAGSEAFIQKASERLEIIADTYLSVATPIQRALPALLADGSITDALQTRIRQNYRTLRTQLAGKSASVLNVEGGWNAIVRLPNVITDDACAVRALKDCNVLVHPGHFFEMEQDSCIVLNLLPEEPTFFAGISRVVECINGIV
jgi:alanine-synthesizing transaminase